MELRTRIFTPEEARRLNPLQLAFLGDGVYELFIRGHLLSDNTGLNVHKLHKEAITYVKAQVVT